MARVTVEDCIDKVENRFDLVLLARIVGQTAGSRVLIRALVGHGRVATRS